MEHEYLLSGRGKLDLDDLACMTWWQDIFLALDANDVLLVRLSFFDVGNPRIPINVDFEGARNAVWMFGVDLGGCLAIQGRMAVAMVVPLNPFCEFRVELGESQVWVRFDETPCFRDEF